MASTACIEKIFEFDLKTESVSSKVKRFEFFFSANKVPAAKHLPVLLSIEELKDVQLPTEPLGTSCAQGQVL